MKVHARRQAGSSADRETRRGGEGWARLRDRLPGGIYMRDERRFSRRGFSVDWTVFAATCRCAEADVRRTLLPAAIHPRLV